MNNERRSAGDRTRDARQELSSWWSPPSSQSLGARMPRERPGDVTPETPPSFNRAVAATDAYEMQSGGAEEAFDRSLVVDRYRAYQVAPSLATHRAAMADPAYETLQDLGGGFRRTYEVHPSSDAARGIGLVGIRDDGTAEEDHELPAWYGRGGNRRGEREGGARYDEGRSVVRPPRMYGARREVSSPRVPWFLPSSEDTEPRGRPGHVTTREVHSSLRRAASASNSAYETRARRSEEDLVRSLAIDGYYTYGVPRSSAGVHSIGSAAIRDDGIAEQGLEGPVLYGRGRSRHEGGEGIFMGTAAGTPSLLVCRERRPPTSNSDGFMVAAPSSFASLGAAMPRDWPGGTVIREAAPSLRRAAPAADGSSATPPDREEGDFGHSLVIDGYCTYAEPPSSASEREIGSVPIGDERIAEGGSETQASHGGGGDQRRGGEGVSTGPAAEAASLPGSGDCPPSATDGHDDEGGETLPDTEVALTSPPSPAPDEPMACGVPVARPVPVQEDPDPVEEEDPPPAEGDLPGPHLGFLGGDVVVATKVNEDEESGEETNDEEANYEVNSEAECPSAEAGDTDMGDSDPAEGPSADEDDSQAGLESRSALGDEEDEPCDDCDEDRVDRYGPVRKLWGVVVSAVAVSGAVGFALGRREAGGPESRKGPDFPPAPSVPSVPPIPSVPSVPRSQQHDAILQLLDPLLRETGSRALNATGSPQTRAVEWLESTSFGAHDNFVLSPWVDQLNVDDGSLLPQDLQERLIQRYVLAVLYFSTGGVEGGDEGEDTGRTDRDYEGDDSGWRDSSFFLTDKHECEWRSASRLGIGLSCNDRNYPWRVRGISLVDNNLRGTLPDELGGLADLRVLDMSSNPGVGGTLPPSLGRLSQLRKLLLEEMSLRGTVPSGYGRLASLKELSLAANDLSGSVPSQVKNMKNLTNVRMNRNRFVDGMNNFCGNDFVIEFLYSDCLCRTFPLLVPEVECVCCTICCTEEGEKQGAETCHTKSPCD